jgi:hypothetical protein
MDWWGLEIFRPTTNGLGTLLISPSVIQAHFTEESKKLSLKHTALRLVLASSFSEMPSRSGIGLFK